VTQLANTTADLRPLVTDYLRRSGMSSEDFALRIGYNYSTVAQYLCGRYSRIAKADQINAAILAFITGNPITSDQLTTKIYETSAVRTMRSLFHKALERPQVYMVYAPPGSGKTDVARHLIAEHNAQSAGQPSYIFRVYCRARICPRDLLKRVATACGAHSSTAIDRAIHNLRWDFRGARVVLYFDESQHLSIPAFETVRELLDEEPRFSLIFAGSHELEKTFNDFSGTLEQLQRRITDKVHLPALTADEAAGILRTELAEFSLDAATIRQQIELATITVRVDKRNQRYISIGRLMAAIREIRDGLAATAEPALQN
jgi:DNA transposition AAA+ family ATPase